MPIRIFRILGLPPAGLLNRASMMTVTSLTLLILSGGCLDNRMDPDQEVMLFPHSALQEVPFQDVEIRDDFWLPRIRLVQEVTIPHLLDIAEKEGKINNFRIIGGFKEGKITLHNAGDSDVYKLIEAAGYSFATRHDSLLKARIDSLILIIASAQLPDGYLNTQYTLPDDHPSSPDLDVLHARRFGYGEKDRWRSTLENWPYAYSQLYCFGHLMEAAVAYHRGTGDTILLGVAGRMASHLRENFPLERIKEYADHPQVEIGLIKLYELSMQTEYLELADRFTRYITFARPRDIRLEESSKPLHEQREAWSHAVRTRYIYTAATDLVRATGAMDLREAMTSIWNNLTGCKMYLHGGVGNGTRFEQHGMDFDLPIENTYSESCASVAQGQWNHRMNLLTGESRYADIVEMEAYNSALAGYGADGRTFLYSNKLNMDTLHRVDYHSGVRTSYLFCCPSKLPGFVTGISRWAYARDPHHLYVNLFIGSEVNTSIGGHRVSLTQETGYPWNGEVTFRFNRGTRAKLGLRIRIPAWHSGEGPIPHAPYYFGNPRPLGMELKLNGRKLPANSWVIRGGYLSVERRFRKGDSITLDLEMPVRRVYTKEEVAANRGRVALMVGPLLYSLEGVDNAFDVLKMQLPSGAPVSVAFKPELLGGVNTLSGEGFVNGRRVVFHAVPYFAWDNRGIHQLCTLMVEDPDALYQEKEEVAKEFNTDG